MKATFALWPSSLKKNQKTKMKAVILHGTKGSPEGNWFPWLKAKLEENGWEVHVPTLPTPKNQSPKSWLEAVKKEAGDISNVEALIGHSLGATFALHLLESRICSAEKTILVSCLIDKIGIPEYDELNAPFIVQPFYWETLKQYAGDISILHGDNDPYVPLEQAQKLGKRLHTEVRLIEDGGHLNAENGYTKFPQLLDILNA